VAADVRNRSHQISVTVEVPDGVVPSGVLLALGCALGGWSLHVLDGRLRYVHNLHGRRLYEVAANSLLGSGRHDLEFRFEKDQGAGGRAALVIDGRSVGAADVGHFTPVAFNEVGIGLTCGYEWGPSVGGDYQVPFAFNGTIVRAEVTATGPVVRDPVAEVAAILASQ
jgi:arylsulfatase